MIIDENNLLHAFRSVDGYCVYLVDLGIFGYRMIVEEEDGEATSVFEQYDDAYEHYKEAVSNLMGGEHPTFI